MYKKLIVFILLVFIALTVNAKTTLNLTQEEKRYIKNNPIIKVGVEQWKPAIYSNDGIDIDGVTGDFLKEIIKDTGLKIEVFNDEWSKVLSSLKNKTIDLIPATYYSKEREKFGLYGDPYYKIKDFIYMKQNNNTINSLKDLEGKILAITKNNGRISDIKLSYPKIKFIFTKDYNEAINLLLNNKVDAIYDSQITMNALIRDNMVIGIKGIAQTTFKAPSLHNFVRIDKPILLSILQKGLRAIPKQKKDEIKEKWLKMISTKPKLLNLTIKQKEYLKNKKTIKMCVDPDWMPFEKIENKKHIGLSSDYIKLIGQSIDIPIKLVQTSSWIDSLKKAKARECDILSLASNTKLRKEYMNFTSSYITAPIVIATRVGISFIDNLDSIINQKLGVVKGYSLHEILRKKYPNINLVEVSSIHDGLDKVESGKIFGYLDNSIVINYEIQRHYLNTIAVSGKFIHQFKLSIATRDDEPILNNIFQKAINNIDQSTKQNILNKWVKVSYASKTDYALVWQILLVVFIIGVFVLYRQHILNKVNIELKIAKQKAEEATQTKSQFLSNMSHEIRTPMNAIIGLTHLALSSSSIKEQKDYLEDINTSSQVLLGIVDNILDFSKIEAGKLTLENQEFNLINTINSVIVMLTYQAQEQDLKLIVNSDISNNDIFKGDSLRVTQVLINLISNAIKFSSSGQVHINIKKENDTRVVFEVVDTGIGITKDNQDKLFNPFVQADGSTTRKYGGTGLGLIISKQLVELMNGTIWVESKIDEGSKFSFAIDLAYIKNPKVNNILDSQKDIATLLNDMKNISHNNILLVEDLSTNQKIVLGLLSSGNIDVDIACDGKEGYEMFKANPNKYALILMDLQMPIMGGLEATKMIRKLDKDIPIIAISANAMKEDLEQTKEVSMNDHIKKPIDVKILYEVLLKYLVKHLDKEYALSLILNDEDIYKEILQGLLEYKDIKFEDLNDKEFFETMHALKGISASSGAMRLTEIIVEIDSTKDRKLLDRFYLEFECVIWEIENY